MTDEIKCPKFKKTGFVLRDAYGYICHAPRIGSMVCGHTFKKRSELVNFENVLDALYELFKDKDVSELEEELSERPNLNEVGCARVLMKNRVVIALINTRRRLDKL